MLQVKSRMSGSFETLDRGVTAKDVANLFAEKKIGSVFVKKGDEFLGVITETDLVRKVIAGNIDASKIPADQIMTKSIVTIDLNASLTDACDIMDKQHIRHLAVTENDEIIGVVSVRDLIRPVYTDGEGW